MNGLGIHSNSDTIFNFAKTIQTDFQFTWISLKYCSVIQDSFSLFVFCFALVFFFETFFLKQNLENDASRVKSLTNIKISRNGRERDWYRVRDREIQRNGEWERKSECDRKKRRNKPTRRKKNYPVWICWKAQQNTSLLLINFLWILPAPSSQHI